VADTAASASAGLARAFMLPIAGAGLAPITPPIHVRRNVPALASEGPAYPDYQAVREPWP
jgi:hypothetical protein